MLYHLRGAVGAGVVDNYDLANWIGGVGEEGA
jgi:hypothetical protein